MTATNLAAFYVTLVRKGVSLDGKVHIVRARPSYYGRPWKAPMQAVCGLSRGGGYHGGGWKVAVKRNEYIRLSKLTNLCETCRAQNMIEELKFE